MRTPVSDCTPLSLIPRLSCMGTQGPGNEAGHYCVVMSNSVLLSVILATVGTQLSLQPSWRPRLMIVPSSH